ARILARSELPENQQRHLQDIELQVNRMTAIIQQLLDCFRHVPDSRRQLDLAVVLADVLERVAEDSRCQEAALEAGPLPVAMPVRAEPLRVGLACLNVIRNACQSARSRVRVCVRDAGEAWQVLVEDDGPGIPEALREQIFEPFYSTRAAGEGTGLGLAVVNSVMKEHGGWIEVGESDMGGCRMSLCFPKEAG
ncbi:MAG TPA: HAMP domain-containing sensor histidine kinase, partial [Marinobacter sp.]|nr:HAMP domain-containing sensor histidine kinase [Marinobacter sp.]